MTGIDWATVGRETFEYIVDVLLGREFGSARARGQRPRW